MNRGPVCCLLGLLALWPTAVRAQPAEAIKLSIQPAPVPSPALKYQLLPEERERSPGNAVILYYRSFSPEWGSHRSPEIVKKIDQWREDARKPPDPALGFVLNYSALKELDLGARREYVDWELTPRLRKDGVNLLLPDIQSFRTSGILLTARARLQFASGKFDSAVYTFQTGFSLGRDVADAPILINALVGIAVIHIMLEQLDEFIQTPGSPNLYWALSSLPQPFISPRKPLQGERIWMESMLPGLRETLTDPKVAVLSTQQVQNYVDNLVSLIADDAGGSSYWQTRLGIAVITARTYPEARRALLARDIPADKVDAMPMTQVVLLYELQQFDRFYDEVLKWQSLPYWQAHRGMERTNQELKEAKAKATPGTFLATTLLPAVEKVMLAFARTERRIAALRCIEAIRLYAASHDGKLPLTLSDIDEVPIPTDPITGRPFDYTLEEGKVTLSAPPPPGTTANRSNTLKYELTLKR